MPDVHTLLLFMLAGLLLLIVPGPAVVYVVGRSIGQGRSAGVVSVLGHRDRVARARGCGGGRHLGDPGLERGGVLDREVRRRRVPGRSSASGRISSAHDSCGAPRALRGSR